MLGPNHYETQLNFLRHSSNSGSAWSERKLGETNFGRMHDQESELEEV